MLNKTIFKVNSTEI